MDTFVNCVSILIHTEHPRLFILDAEKGQFFTESRRIDPQSMDLFTYVNAKFIYLEQHFQKQLILLYNDLIRQSCEIERRVLQNAIIIASLTPNEFALQFLKEPGYIAHVLGEVIKFAKCTPVEVQCRDTKNCYQELPVMRGENETPYFMLPKTHILVKTGTQIDCNPLLAPVYHLQNAWYEFTPRPSLVPTPHHLSITTNYSWTYVSAQGLATGGIYSNSDIERLTDHLMFPIERSAILHTIARGATGQQIADKSIKINSLIDENAFRETLSKAWGKVYNFFNTIGTFSVTMFGIYLTCKAIKFILDTLIHGYALHAIYGWSICLIGAFWDSVTNLLLHLRFRNNIKNKSEFETKICKNDSKNNLELGERLYPYLPRSITNEPITVSPTPYAPTQYTYSDEELTHRPMDNSVKPHEIIIINFN